MASTVARSDSGNTSSVDGLSGSSVSTHNFREPTDAAVASRVGKVEAVPVKDRFTPRLGRGRTTKGDLAYSPGSFPLDGPNRSLVDSATER